MTHPFEGVLSVDKPAGMTSHDVVNVIRRQAGMRRIGHAGTLDPLATGVLLLCLGRATRLIEYLMGRPKRYRAVIRLGQATNTYDADGEVVSERPCAVTPAQLAAALPAFRGEIAQVPPIFSAIKKDGQPLYKLARRGETVELQPRPVTIYELALVAYERPLVTLDVACSTGTYIRSLAHDLGELLGCGGHITMLRRTAVGDFSLETAVALDRLTPDNLDQYVQAPDTAVTHLPRLDLSPEDAARLWQGQPAPRQVDAPGGELVRAYAPDNVFVGIVCAQQETWQARKMFPPL